jgi:triosephosphate isomerase (TIM)
MKKVLRVPLIVGNWKMYKGADEGAKAAREVARLVASVHSVEVGLAPPFTALYPIKKALEGSNVKLAAQNVYWEEQGAFTGAISPLMLEDVGCDYCLVGHSERRALFRETDETVNKKVRALLGHKVTPIVCVGESLPERDAGEAARKVTSQLEAGLHGFTPKEISALVIAYEPIWAIGTGRNATPAQAEEIHQIIRTVLLRLAGDEAYSIRILYGGSVKPENAAALIAEENVDGALVGGASLDPEGFSKIVKQAHHS